MVVNTKERRKKVFTRLENFVFVKPKDYSRFSTEKLERFADILEQSFEDAFKEDENDDGEI